jgi:glycosyltransferase involved in cell wall biosynthesis
VVPPAKDPFLIPATSEVQTRIKEEFTDGKEYFIANISEKDPGEFIKLLKAFSIFKKRQQSNMKLVIIPLNNETHGIFQEHLENYKYNGDVILRNNLSLMEQARLLGSAYACIYLSPVYFEGMALEALQPGIPVLLPINSPMSEITGDAALYFNASEITSLADQLMLIFKDEDLRNKLILKGKNLAAKYNWEQTVIVFRQSIAEAIQ